MDDSTGEIERYLRKALGGFAPGDTVWYIKHESVIMKCPHCDGEKEIVAQMHGKLKNIRCPFCWGTGESLNFITRPKETKIVAISLRVFFDGEKVDYWNLKNFVLLGTEDYVEVCDLYKTKSEALDAIMERSGKDNEYWMKRNRENCSNGET